MTFGELVHAPDGGPFVAGKSRHQSAPNKLIRLNRAAPGPRPLIVLPQPGRRMQPDAVLHDQGQIESILRLTEVADRRRDTLRPSRISDIGARIGAVVILI